MNSTPTTKRSSATCWLYHDSVSQSGLCQPVPAASEEAARFAVSVQPVRGTRGKHRGKSRLRPLAHGLLRKPSGDRAARGPSKENAPMFDLRNVSRPTLLGMLAICLATACGSSGNGGE